MNERDQTAALTPDQTALAVRLLRQIAKIEMTSNAAPGEWVARTLRCNDMVTAGQVEDARRLLRALMPEAEHLDGWRGAVREPAHG